MTSCNDTPTSDDVSINGPSRPQWHLPASVTCSGSVNQDSGLLVTSDLFYFLVNKLHEYLPESSDKNALQNKRQRADELVSYKFSPPLVYDLVLSKYHFHEKECKGAGITFVASVVKRVVKGFSASLQLLSPCQAVLLYQQFYVLKSCLQYSKTLADFIRNDYREEFRLHLTVAVMLLTCLEDLKVANPTEGDNSLWIAHSTKSLERNN
ncbi:hypothetical protein TREES_T100007821 [Tupaia chinensis]|uniref:Uncharacterized protein n=1 Tax=Tupaia chinensis TaxID=246437 RepID=L9KLF1_TUPCH|nr:hypothetical protein TREES_T100007821 [Tupaia chinensis]